MKGVIIVSGGMDSITLVHHLQNKYPAAEWHLLSFDYGQRHLKEIAYALEFSQKRQMVHHVINLQQLTNLLLPSGSVLVDPSLEVPEGHYAELSMRATVVPNRNSIMLSIATAIAVAEQAEFVAAGMHAGDHYIYPDCRPEFARLFNHTMHLANLEFWEGQVIFPFIDISKADIVRIGWDLDVNYAETWSCYKGGEVHCGKCGTCVERIEAFQLAGVPDPTVYDTAPV